MLDGHVLVLNRVFQAVQIITARKAFALLYKGHVRAVLEGVTFTDRRPDGETSWWTERMAVHKLAYRSNLYVLEVAGLQSFELPGEAGGVHRPLAPGQVAGLAGRDAGL